MKIYQPELNQKKINMLIMGEAGVGKTSCAGSSTAVPEMSKVLYMNVEGGNLSLINAEIMGIPYPPDMLDITDWAQMNETVEFLYTAKHDYKTLIVDSFSELSKLNVDYIVSESIRKKSKHPDREIDEVYLEDWGKNAQLMRRLARALRDLQMHVILITHTRTIKIQNVEYLAPSLGPELGKSVVSMMDIVGYLRIIEKEKEDKTKESVRQLVTKTLPGYMTKDRSPGGKLGGVNYNPSMNTLYRKLYGETNVTD